MALEQRDQLVVELTRLVDLLTRLTRLGVRADDRIEKSDGLELALVTLAPDWTRPKGVATVDDLAALLRKDLGGPDNLGRNHVSDLGIPQGFLVTSAAAVGTKDKIPHAVGEPVPYAGMLAMAADPDDGAGVRIGILDTPLRRPPDLGGPYLADPVATEPSGPVDPLAGHSLFVAGLIRQYAPAAPLTVRSVPGLENGRTSTWETAKRMYAFAGWKLDILHLSLGARHPGPAPLDLVRAVRAIRKASPRTLIVVAAGNYPTPEEAQNPTEETWPAALSEREVVAVGATRNDGEAAWFSPLADWVDCQAPGVNVAGRYLDGWVLIHPLDPDSKARDMDQFSPEYRVANDLRAVPELTADQSGRYPGRFTGMATWSGTSFAAAIATGAIAAELSRMRRTDPTAKAHDAYRSVLKSGGVVRDYKG